MCQFFCRARFSGRRWLPYLDSGSLLAAEQTKKSLQERGITAVKAHVRADAFAAWCRDIGRDVNTRALTASGNEAALRVQTGAKSH
jgi:hypothetical protein